MTEHRAFHNHSLKRYEIGDRVPLLKDSAHRFFRVLRLKIGDRAELFDGQGTLLIGSLQEDGSPNLVIEKKVAAKPPQLKLQIAQALLGSDKIEQVLKQGTEIGVDVFCLFESDFGLVKKDKLTHAKVERLLRIVQDAARQSERLFVPELVGPMPFDTLIQKLKSSEVLALFGAPRTDMRLFEVLEQNWESQKEGITMVIGPEGGLSLGEVRRLESIGAFPCSLGPHILRTQTAPLVAASMIQCFLKRA